MLNVGNSAAFSPFAYAASQGANNSSALSPYTGGQSSAGLSSQNNSGSFTTPEIQGLLNLMQTMLPANPNNSVTSLNNPDFLAAESALQSYIAMGGQNSDSSNQTDPTYASGYGTDPSLLDQGAQGDPYGEEAAS